VRESIRAKEDDLLGLVAQQPLFGTLSKIEQWRPKIDVYGSFDDVIEKGWKSREIEVIPIVF